MALGQSDYGLFGVVGSMILLMTILNGGLSFGISRFYAFSIGEGKGRKAEDSDDELMRWFNAALSIHIVLPFVIFVVGLILGEYAIQNWLTIPSDRVHASLWVFRISLVGAVVNIASVPFVSMLNAHQRIYLVSIAGVLRSVASFLAALAILNADGDRLILYAIYMTAAGSLLQLALMFCAYRSFPSCRIRLSYMYEWGRIKELFNFTGWKMYGMSCVALRQQGVPVVMNLSFGPIANAAFMVASSLSNHANALSTALNRAFLPAVVTAEGSGDREKMLSMALRVCKFGSLLVSIFALPAILEMDRILKIWLSEPPVHAGTICQWLLAILIVDRATVGHALAVNAHGRIAAYELIQGTIIFSAVPFSYIVFTLGFGPSAVGIVLFLVMSVCFVGRIAFAFKLVAFKLMPWIRAVLFPLTVLVLAGICIGVGIRQIMNESFLRLVASFASVSTVICLLSWLILLDTEEKDWLEATVRKLYGGLVSRVPFLGALGKS